MMTTPASSPRSSHKRLHPETISDDCVSLTDKMTLIAQKKIEQQIAESSVKCARYESITATSTVQIEKEQLLQEERVLKMKYQREREKEAHQFCMLELQVAMKQTQVTPINPSIVPNFGQFNPQFVMPHQAVPPQASDHALNAMLSLNADDSDGADGFLDDLYASL